jgi:hypothetical protein
VIFVRFDAFILNNLTADHVRFSITLHLFFTNNKADVMQQLEAENFGVQN